MPKYGSVNTSVLASQLIAGYWNWDASVNGGEAGARQWENSNPGQPVAISVNIFNLQSDQQALARLAVRVWEDVANIHVTFVPGDDADIVFTDAPADDGSPAAETPLTSSGGDIISALVDVSRNWANGPSSSPYNYFFQSMVHEMGHALGLGHPGNYNGTADYKKNETLYANDTWQKSIMSYNEQSNYGASDNWVLTPQIADIYAIQKMYGAAATRIGDSIYGFNSNIVDPDGNVNIYNFANYVNRRHPNDAPSFTIYDSSGIDTLDCSGFTADQTVDLRDGSFSSVGSYKENIAIYKGVVIENAVGGSGADTITGNDVANFLTGGAGNDTLTGGLGIDTLVGGLGDDVYYVDRSSDVIIEDPDGGIDEVRSTSSTFILGNNVENLIYLGIDDKFLGFYGTGNALDNTITGGAEGDTLVGGAGDDNLIGGFGRDILFGEAGNDTLRGGGGDDTVNGGEGVDIVYYGDLLTKGIIDLNIGKATFPQSQTAGTDILQNIEGVVTGKGNDIVTGNSADNIFYFTGEYNSSNNVGGFDTFDGSAGTDTLAFSLFSGRVSVDLSEGTATANFSVQNGGGARRLSEFSSIENVIASRGDDKITGDDKDNTITYIGSYRNTLEIGGFDTYSGGKGNDTVDFSQFRARIFVDLASGTVNSTPNVILSGKPRDEIAHVSGIENVIATIRNDSISGDDKDNTFTYVGAYGYGLDTGGFDTYVGGGGSDTIDFSRFSGRISLDLTDGIAGASYSVGLPDGGSAEGFSQISRISGVESMISTLGDDTFTGDGNDNTFTFIGTYVFGGDTGGTDHFNGGEGSDTLDLSRFVGFGQVDLEGGFFASSYTYQTETGGGGSVRQMALLTGVENAIGTKVSDLLEGDTANNVFFGRGGNDQLRGRGGDDTLSGGIGADTFRFDSGFGHDVITDFAADSKAGTSHDIIRFYGPIFASWDQLEVAITDSADGAVITVDAENTVTLTGVTKQELVDNHEADFLLV